MADWTDAFYNDVPDSPEPSNTSGNWTDAFYADTNDLNYGREPGPVDITPRPTNTDWAYGQDTGRGAFAPQPQQQANYDMLSPAEQFIYNRLPGFTESTVGQALARFSDSWAGKMLAYLDVPAEGVERTIGLVAQFIDAADDPAMMQDLMDNLGAAWSAGSLWSDMTNLPQLTWEDGRIVGVHIPSELPGVAGMVDARNRLIDGDPLALVRDDYYNDLGALALRAQMYDLYTHVLLDPLNYIMPALKPVEALQASRYTIMSTKIADSAIDSLNAGLDAVKISNKLDDAMDIAMRTVNILSDAKITIADDLLDGLKAAEKSGDVADVVKITEKLFDDLPSMTQMDKLKIAITGGDPFAVKPGMERKWYNPVTWAALTPEARAEELLTMISDNVGTYILANMDDPTDIVKTIEKAMNGSLGPEYGHAFLTLEGRTAQAALAGFDVAAKETLAEFTAAQKYVDDLTNIAEAIGKNLDELLDTLKYEDNIASVAQKVGMNSDQLGAMAKAVGDAPYSPELFKFKLTNRLIDHAAKQAVVQFGVKPRGFLTRLSNTVKSAETMAFLRLNPKYLFRNVLNNEMTMLARGLSGSFTMADIRKMGKVLGIEDIASARNFDDFWKAMGFEPQRLRQGFGMAGKGIGEDVGSVSRALIDATQGKRGFLEKTKDAFNNVNLGKLDMSVYARQHEEFSSLRAFTNGYVQGMKKFWQPGKSFDNVSTYLKADDLATLRKIDPDIANTIERAVASSYTQEMIDDVIRSPNLNLNPESIFDEASKLFGKNIKDVLPEEYVAKIEDVLRGLDSPTQIKKALTGIKDELQSHLDEMMGDYSATVANRVTEAVKAGNYNEIARVYSEAMDVFWGGHMSYSQEMQKLTELIRGSLKDKNLARLFWDSTFEKQSKYYERYWNFLDETIAGIKTGAKEAGIKGEGVIYDSFKSWRKGWDDFFKQRNKQLADFFELPSKQRTPELWQSIQADLDGRYAAMIDLERTNVRGIDETIAKMLDDPAMQARYLDGRNSLADLRTANEEKIIGFRQTLDGMSLEQKEEAWLKFWQEQYVHYDDLRNTERSMFKDMMEGIDEAPQYVHMVDETGQPTLIPPGIPRTSEGIAEWLGIDPIHIDNNMEKLIKNLFGDDVTVGDYSKVRKMFDDDIDSIIDNIPIDDDIVISDDALRNLQARILERGDEVPDAAKAATVAEEAPVSKKLWEMTPEEYFDELEKAKQAEKNATVTVFGEEDAKKYDSAFRRSGTSDEAARIVDEMEASLSKEQLDLLHGIGEEGYGYDELFSYRRAFDDLTSAPDDELLTNIRYGISRIDPQQLAKGGPEGLTTGLEDYLKVRNSWQELLGRGLTDEDILVRVGKELADTIGAEDAKFIIESFGKQADTPVGAVDEVADVRKTATGFLDTDEILPHPDPLPLGQDQFWTNRGFGIIDNIQDAAIAQAKKPSLKWSDIPEDIAGKLDDYIARVKGQMADARYASTRFAEFRRDAALLNYNRRMNYNTYLGVLAPFEFWMTQSFAKWALHSIDRPAMLTTYLRIKELLNTAGAPNQVLPSRMRDHFKIPMPFMPSWMGDSLFVNPLKNLLPFESFTYPYEEFKRTMFSAEKNATWVIEGWIEDGTISEEEGMLAIENQEGDIWDRAVSEGFDKNAFDFMSLFASPHAPIMWAYEILQGTPEEIQPFLPVTRLSKGLTGFIDGALNTNLSDFPFAPHNIEGKVRTMLGLPPFDNWEDYRVDRMLSNMVGTGEISVDEARLAMINRQGPAFEEAVRKANMEYGIKEVSGLLTMMLFDGRIFPEGEEKQRELYNQMVEAYRAEEAGDETAVRKFFEENPEIQARLALFDTPEERLKMFINDQIWNKYNEMPKLHKTEIRDILGPEFQELFLNKDTRNLDAINLETMQVWLKLMGGDPPGTFTGYVPPIELAPLDVALRAQVYYDTKDELFPNIWETQQAYYALSTDDNYAARNAYKQEHPELVAYWEWNRNWLMRNPDVAVYLTDDPVKIEKYEAAIPQMPRAGGQTQPQFTWNEWQQVLDQPTQNLILDMAYSDEQLPKAVYDNLDILAEQYGLPSGEALLQLIMRSVPQMAY